MSNYQKIIACVSTASIPETDKTDIVEIFGKISEEYLENIAFLFETKPNWITIFNETRKKKQHALASGDPSLIQEIVEQEKKYVRDLLYDLD